MQDLRSRIGRTLSMALAVYLIQALSFSTVYAAVISGDFNQPIQPAQQVTQSSPLASASDESFSPLRALSAFSSAVAPFSLTKNNYDRNFLPSTFVNSSATSKSNTSLFGSLNSNTNPATFSLLKAEKRSVGVAGDGVVSPVFKNGIAILTSIISNDVFSDNTYIKKDSAKKYDFVKPVIATIKTTYLSSYPSFGVGISKTYAQQSEYKTSNTFALFDRASLTLYCKSSSLFASPDVDRCDYDKVLLGLPKQQPVTVTSTPITAGTTPGSVASSNNVTS
jgi:hypothetical protein